MTILVSKVNLARTKYIYCNDFNDCSKPWTDILVTWKLPDL